jgi:hypothetical protein
MIEPASYADVLVIASTMRDSDRAEIYATRFGEDPFDVARVAMLSQHKYVYRQPAGPLVAAFGALQLWPGVWSIWLFANDLWTPSAARRVIRFVRGMLSTERFHRVECRSLATHSDAHGFIQALGLRPECVLHAYGRGQEDFVVFSRLHC